MDHLHVLEISEVIQLRNCPLCMKSKTRDWQNHLIQSIVWKCAVGYLRHVKGADMDVMGSHRQYDQGFMKNLERLQQTDSSQHSTSQWHHSPRKQSCPDSKIFPPDCIFCGVVSKTLPAFGCSSHKTERCIVFTMPSAWDSLEPWAEKLRKENLLCKIRGFVTVVFSWGEVPP